MVAALESRLGWGQQQDRAKKTRSCWYVSHAAPCPTELLLDVHTQEYLSALETSSLKVAQVTELGVLAMLPSFLTRSKVVHPMRQMAAGSVLALGLAAECGWAIHVGGGMHHAHRENGGGWCMYADWILAIR